MNLKKTVFLIALMATGTAMMISCNMGDYPGYKKTKTGIYYKIYTKDNDDTARVNTGDIVSVYLKYGTKDSVLFDSKNIPEDIMFPVAESKYEGDFYEALRMFNRNDSASFILKAGPFFTKTFGQPAVPDFLTDETDIYFDVKINKVQTEEDIELEAIERNAELAQEEIENLEQYIRENGITAQPSENGVYYIETKKGSGKSPVKDGYTSVHFTVHLLGGERLFSTYDRKEPIDFKFGSQFENAGFQEALGLMKEGGKANAIVPSALAFGEKGAQGIVPPFSTLFYEIELVDVMNDAEWDKKQAEKTAKQQADNARKGKEEDASIQKFMQENNMKPTTVLPSGLVYVETLAGSGPKPVSGKKVKVHYTGKLMNGSVFDSSVERGQPYEFVIGQRAVIEGWDLGIPLMGEGGKGTLIVPSRLAYGDRGAGNAIPPNASLIFDVELVEVEK